MKRKIIPYNPKLKTFARKLRKEMTLAEVLLWNELKQKQIFGYDFDRQKPLDEYIVDFYCKDLMLAIEVDGISHVTDEAYIDDMKRQQRLESLGVKFLRFDDEEVRKELANVVRSIEGWILDWEEMNPDKKYPGRVGNQKEPTPGPSREGSLRITQFGKL